MTDARQYAPATTRNRAPILQILKPRLRPNSYVLEIASGTGEHGLFFSQQIPHILWQPTDMNPEALDSIQAWQDHAGSPSFLPPQKVDVQKPQWWIDIQKSVATSNPLNTIVNINMIHISPWNATEGLFQGVGKLLSVQGLLFLYGPYKRNGQHTSESNAQFDAQLQARNPLWGVRDLEDIIQLGTQHGLKIQEILEMPANNLSLVFSRLEITQP